MSHTTPKLPRLRGYRRLALLMSKEYSLAMFHRFDDLLLLQLLSLQAEIFELQTLFATQSKLDDDSQKEPEKAFSTSFRQLRCHPGSVQYKLLLELRAKQLEYNELLLQASQMTMLPIPRERDLKELQSWLSDKRGGDCFQKGGEARMWHEDFIPSDFISLVPSTGEADYFTGWLTSITVGLIHRWFGTCCGLGEVVDEESGLRSYNDSTINAVSKIFSTVVSSVLPIVTILVLYKIQSTWWRIAASIFFTALFAFFLSIFSEARRVEIFAATATFAAVEVVFIGSALGNGH